MAEERSTPMRSNPIRMVDKDGLEVSLVSLTDSLGEESTAAETHDLGLEAVVDELRQMRFLLSSILVELQRLTLGISMMSGDDVTMAQVAATQLP